ncbi:hypothetical protein [Spiroplasma culicicola]|uniref:Transmembrane protein n=1 Tax=Spiroplasma culicicola AES-1 TaxID=1276246 RepID=W6A8F4_9MOLU|nr:hypothetical protein [Spiroplasma culicicola]AHI53170.1 hypothetical protein SCULI_v1c08300 [Spiroplasma culicicola AES-1]
MDTNWLTSWGWIVILITVLVISTILGILQYIFVAKWRAMRETPKKGFIKILLIITGIISILACFIGAFLVKEGSFNERWERFFPVNYRYRSRTLSNAERIIALILIILAVVMISAYIIYLIVK